MMPLVGAIAAGNTVFLKSSRNTPKVSVVIEKILSVFDKDYIFVMENTKENMNKLFDLKFDYVFYTGSPNVAKELMEKQAKYLTPMTLELGGKSPCIVDKTANIKTCAKRVVWGKYLNAGQTCVAPDYVFVHENIKSEFIKNVKEFIKQFYYTDNKLDDSFTAIINEKSLNKLVGLIDKEKTVFGGNVFNNVLEPTLLDNVCLEDEIMKEEIFGPIMPIIEYSDLDDVINYLKYKDKPLALYYFGKDYKKVLKNVSFGGGCINDTIMHLTEEKLPFGGIGLSGIGSYHGKKSFEIFSHQKSVLKKNSRLELSLKYPKYKDLKKKITKIYFGIKNK
jgi:aldehyde dehydrogenase (NAD+)